MYISELSRKISVCMSIAGELCILPWFPLARQSGVFHLWTPSEGIRTKNHPKQGSQKFPEKVPLWHNFWSNDENSPGVGRICLAQEMMRRRSKQPPMPNNPVWVQGVLFEVISEANGFQSDYIGNVLTWTAEGSWSARFAFADYMIWIFDQSRKRVRLQGKRREYEAQIWISNSLSNVQAIQSRHWLCYFESVQHNAHCSTGSSVILRSKLNDLSTALVPWFAGKGIGWVGYCKASGHCIVPTIWTLWIL